MNMLFIGGTGFLSHYLTEVALERGHTVTLFNRGKRAPDLFPKVEQKLTPTKGLEPPT